MGGGGYQGREGIGKTPLQTLRDIIWPAVPALSAGVRLGWFFLSFMCRDLPTIKDGGGRLDVIGAERQCFSCISAS